MYIHTRCVCERRATTRSLIQFDVDVRNVLLFIATLFVHNTQFVHSAPVQKTTFNTVTTVAMTTASVTQVTPNSVVQGTRGSPHGTSPHSTSPMSTGFKPPNSPTTATTSSTGSSSTHTPPPRGVSSSTLPSSTSNITSALKPDKAPPLSSEPPSSAPSSPSTPSASFAKSPRPSQTHPVSTSSSKKTSRRAPGVTVAASIPHTPMATARASAVKMGVPETVPSSSQGKKKIDCKRLRRRGIPCGDSSQLSGWN